MPNYVSRMWMKTAAGGLVAAMHGPSSVTFVSKGQPVQIDSRTDYPFSEQIEFVVQAETAVAFPFLMHVPTWCTEPTLTLNGQPVPVVVKNGFARLERTFRAGDKVVLTLPMELKANSWGSERIIHKIKTYDDEGLHEPSDANQIGGDGVYFEYGPLVLSLLIDEQWEENPAPLTMTVKLPDGTREQKKMAIGSKAFPAWDITPKSPWNYGVNPREICKKANVSRTAMPDNPWVSATTPLKVTLPATRVTNWTYDANSQKMRHKQPRIPHQLDLAPTSERITLVPLGATHLRVTVFPEIKK
jgi:hypothetical protein